MFFFVQRLLVSSHAAQRPTTEAPPLISHGWYTSSQRRWSIVALTFIVLIGVGLRSYQLSERSLWFDEAFSWRLSRSLFAEMIQRVGQDNHPPLYFILLKGWTILFGESPFALRSLSVLFGCLSILGTYLFAAEAFDETHRTAETNSDLQARGRGIGLFAAAFVALSAFQVRYSWEVRMYALAVTLAVFSSWALFRARRPPSQLRRNRQGQQ